MTLLARLSAALIVLSLAIAGATWSAQAADRAIIILDASGSMWAQIDGKARIDIARDSLKQVLAGVPDTLELGFMAYGHRSKGDCNDIETLVEPAPGTSEAIAKAAAGLSPKGKTPLSASVRMAAEDLKYTEDKATVILITDGIETCDADPCALASELKSSGVDFTVDVVGFGLSDDEGAQVKCLADNTGGQYIAAGDADGLTSALHDVVQTVAQPSSAPPPPASSEEPSTDNFTPSAVLGPNGPEVTDELGTIAWEFHKVNADGSEGDWVRTEYGAHHHWAIEPGKYVVTARLDYASASQTLDFNPGARQTPGFNLNAGHIDLRPFAAEGSEVDGNAAVFTEFANGESTTSYGEMKGYVPAGDTKVTVTIGAAKLETVVSVAAGESVSKDLVVGAGRANITASFAAGQPVGDSKLFVEVFGAKKDMQGNRQSFGNGYGPTIAIDLPPGDYVADATYDAVKVEQPISIKAGEATDLDILLNAGALAVSAPNGNYVEVFAARKDIQGNRVSFGGSYDMAATRTLPAGSYHIVVTMKDGSSKETDATVTVGERTEITVE